jgi:uncharacterized protein involved in outer membrane biogenesis
MAVTLGRRKWTVVLGTIAFLLIVLIIFWDWNWFIPIVERVASAKLHRQVRIGHLSLHLSRQPRLVLNNLSISDPPDDPAKGSLATVDEFDLQVDALSLFHHQLIIPEIRFVHPVIELHRYGKDETNYAFTSGGSSTTASAPPQVGALIVEDGQIHLNDPTLKADVKMTVNTPVEAGKRMLRLDAAGTYSGQKILAHFTGGSVLDLQDAKNPYPVDLDIRNGDTHVAAKGTVQDPIHFGGANVTLLLQGDDLSQLYPLTGVPIPPTPKYKLTGALDAAGQDIRFRNFAGTVGESDLEGTITETPGKERPFVTADMQSRHVVLADLAGFIGNTPGDESAAASTPKQREKKAAEEASAPLLPTTPIDLPKLRAADLSVHYVGKRIDSRTTPLDDLDMRLAVQDGTIRLEPLKFGMGQGSILINIALNGQQDQVHAKGSLELQHVDLKRIMQDLKPFKGTGIISGRADLDTVGNSPAAMLANGNGRASMSMTGGDLSALLADLGGLEVGRAVYRYLGANEQTPVHCMVADVGLEKGTLATKTFVLDTGEENLYLSGTMNFQSQTLDLKLTSEAKHFSVLSVKAPIDISGSMRNPSVAPDAAALAKRGVPAAVLGVLLTPVASLLATVQLGDDSSDTGCKDLVAAVKKLEASEAKSPTPPMPPAGQAAPSRAK